MTPTRDSSPEPAQGTATAGLELPAPEETAMFLDFDGVLTEIGETPDGIRVDEAVHEMLPLLLAGTGGATAIISGRTISDIRKFLPGFTGVVVGGHGAERARGDEVTEHPLAGSEAVREMTERLHDFARGRDGLLVEQKPAGVVLHYRKAAGREGEVREFMNALLPDFPGFALTPAKMALELRPDDVGKRHAVSDLASEAPFKGRRPVYFGDDTTDEEAMEWVLEQGGVAVKVGEGDSCAQERVEGPRHVADYLTRWCGGKEAF